MNTKRHTFVSVETTSFSGATLLAFVLNAHPQIASIGEMNGLHPKADVETYVCSCGQKIRSCDFWHAMTCSMEQKGFNFDVADFDLQFQLGGPDLVQRLRRGSFRNNTLDDVRDSIFHAWPAEKQQIKQAVERNQAFIQSVLTVTNKDVLVDTAKDRIRLRALRKFSTLNVRIIHLVRDVRGVVASWLRRGRNNIPESATQWVKWHNRLEKSWGTLPADTYIRIRYEDLCQDVPGTLKQLYKFCGVDSEIEIDDFRQASHHIVGNQMRLDNLSKIKLDERWRNTLTREQLQQINKLAGDLNRHYGYSN